MKLLASLVALLVAAPAFADGLVYVPKWHMKDGEACYAFDQAKQLVVLDAELAACDVQKQTVKDLRASVFDLKAAVDTQQKSNALCLGQAEGLKGQLETCVSARAKLEAESHKLSWGWAVAGGLTLTLVGVLLGVYVR